MEKRKAFRITLPALCTTLLLATAVTGFAWLATHKSTEMTMAADHTPEISISMATYVPATSGEAAKYTWSEFLPMEENHEKAGAYGAKFDINNRNSHFGEIDNLTTLKVSNCAWFCIRVHEEEGKSFSNLRIHYNTQPYWFYGSEWANGKATDVKPVDTYNGAYKDSELHSKAAEIRGKLKNIQDTVIQELMFVAKPNANFVTATPPTQFFGNTISMDNPAVDTSADNLDYVRLASDQGPTKPGFSGTAAAVDTNGYYYIYLRVWPNLKQYYEFVKQLYPYMPCYLSFQDMTVTIDVTTAAGTKK